eukprot:4303317-Prymnesium_polylepis.1
MEGPRAVEYTHKSGVCVLRVDGTWHADRRTGHVSGTRNRHGVCVLRVCRAADANRARVRGRANDAH